jgi:hypothetical protein
MDVELEKVFSPEVLAALDERVRRTAREEASRAKVEWLDIPAVMQLTSMTESAARQFINGLKAAESPDVYQPNGPARARW